MLLGEFKHSLDAKNRLAVPVKFRSRLKNGLVITKGLDECLFAYPKADWRDKAKRLSQLPVSQAYARAYARMMLGGAMEDILDKQGRVLIPEYLKEYAHLNKNVVVVGVYDRLEFWDAERWEQYKARTERDSEHIAETLSEKGV